MEWGKRDGTGRDQIVAAGFVAFLPEIRRVHQGPSDAQTSADLREGAVERLASEERGTDGAGGGNAGSDVAGISVDPPLGP